MCCHFQHLRYVYEAFLAPLDESFVGDYQNDLLSYGISLHHCSMTQFLFTSRVQLPSYTFAHVETKHNNGFVVQWSSTSSSGEDEHFQWIFRLARPVVTTRKGAWKIYVRFVARSTFVAGLRYSSLSTATSKQPSRTEQKSNVAMVFFPFGLHVGQHSFFCLSPPKR